MPIPGAEFNGTMNGVFPATWGIEELLAGMWAAVVGIKSWARKRFLIA